MLAGLGNPGQQYVQTRHNIGFRVIDFLTVELKASMPREKFNGLIFTAEAAGKKILLVKPQTYMNESGRCLLELLQFYKLEHSALTVIYDDIDLEPGQLRIRKQGSAGGHNGIKDIIRQLGTEKFLRIKVGVGAKPKGWDLADHVLGRFSTEDRKLVDEAIAKAAKAVDIIITQGTDAAMNEYNRKVPVQK